MHRHLIAKLKNLQEKWSVVGHSLDGRYLLRPSFDDPEIYLTDRHALDAHLGRALRSYAALALMLLSLLVLLVPDLWWLFPLAINFAFIILSVNIVSEGRSLARLEIINLEESELVRQSLYWKTFAAIVVKIAGIVLGALLMALMFWADVGIFDEGGNISLNRLIVFSPTFFVFPVMAAGLWRNFAPRHAAKGLTRD
jgi:hypothetical protein